MYWIIFILSTYTIVSIFIIINLLKKYEKLEDYSETLESWVNNLNTRLNQIYRQIKAIDHNGSFEADDEIGSTFDQIRDIIKTLDNFILKDEDHKLDDRKEKK